MEWVVCMCVWACLHLQLCQSLQSPAAILPPHPKLARAHTHMQSIPQEMRREWQAGAGGGETSQEANRCSPSGFSQVAYIKRKRGGKKPKKMKTSLRMGRLNTVFFQEQLSFFSVFFAAEAEFRLSTLYFIMKIRYIQFEHTWWIYSNIKVV